MNRSSAACGLMDRTDHAQGEWRRLFQLQQRVKGIHEAPKGIENEPYRTIVIKGLRHDMVNKNNPKSIDEPKKLL